MKLFRSWVAKKFLVGQVVKNFMRGTKIGGQKMHNKSLKQRHFVAGQFVSSAFVVLLCKNNSKSHDLQTAVVL